MCKYMMWYVTSSQSEFRNEWLCTAIGVSVMCKCVISSHSGSLSLLSLDHQRLVLLIAVLEKEGRGTGSGVARRD